MEVQMSLAQLKTAIKDFKNGTPKLTGRKADLHAFAERVGILKARADSAPDAVAVEKKVKVESLPEVLKKPAAKVARPDTPAKKVSKNVVVPETKVKPSFAAFMAANKGKGLNMSEMARLFKEQKEAS